MLLAPFWLLLLLGVVLLAHRVLKWPNACATLSRLGSQALAALSPGWPPPWRLNEGGTKGNGSRELHRSSSLSTREEPCDVKARPSKGAAAPGSRAGYSGYIQQSFSSLQKLLWALQSSSGPAELGTALERLLDHSFKDPTTCLQFCLLDGIAALSQALEDLHDCMVSGTGRDHGVASNACLQASWLLVQLGHGPPMVRRALLNQLSLERIEGLMRDMRSARRPHVSRASRSLAIRNCCWCLLALVDVAWIPLPAPSVETQEHSDSGTGAVGDSGGSASLLALGIQAGTMLLDQPTVVQLLCSVLRGGQGADPALVAAALLASIALLHEQQPHLAVRAQAAMLKSPGGLGTALRTIAASHGAPGASSPAPAANGHYNGINDDNGDNMPPGPALRAHQVLVHYLSQACARNPSDLLQCLVSERAIGPALHCAALPLQLRQRLLAALMGGQGQAVLEFSEPWVDAPLALCHAIIAPLACHVLVRGKVPSASNTGTDTSAAAAGAAADPDGAAAVQQQASSDGSVPECKSMSSLALACRLLLSGQKLTRLVDAFLFDLSPPSSAASRMMPMVLRSPMQPAVATATTGTSRLSPGSNVVPQQQQQQSSSSSGGMAVRPPPQHTRRYAAPMPSARGLQRGATQPEERRKVMRSISTQGIEAPAAPDNTSTLPPQQPSLKPARRALRRASWSWHDASPFDADAARDLPALCGQGINALDAVLAGGQSLDGGSCAPGDDRSGEQGEPAAMTTLLDRMASDGVSPFITPNFEMRAGNAESMPGSHADVDAGNSAGGSGSLPGRSPAAARSASCSPSYSSSSYSMSMYNDGGAGAAGDDPSTLGARVCAAGEAAHNPARPCLPPPMMGGLTDAIVGVACLLEFLSQRGHVSLAAFRPIQGRGVERTHSASFSGFSQDVTPGCERGSGGDMLGLANSSGGSRRAGADTGSGPIHPMLQQQPVSDSSAASAAANPAVPASGSSSSKLLLEASGHNTAVGRRSSSGLRSGGADMQGPEASDDLLPTGAAGPAVSAHRTGVLQQQHRFWNSAPNAELADARTHVLGMYNGAEDSTPLPIVLESISVDLGSVADGWAHQGDRPSTGRDSSAAKLHHLLLPAQPLEPASSAQQHKPYQVRDALGELGSRLDSLSGPSDGEDEAEESSAAAVGAVTNSAATLSDWALHGAGLALAAVSLPTAVLTPGEAARRMAAASELTAAGASSRCNPGKARLAAQEPPLLQAALDLWQGGSGIAGRPPSGEAPPLPHEGLQALSLADLALCAAGDGPGAVFQFGEHQVRLSEPAYRAFRHVSPLIYDWLSRLPHPPKQPITLLQVPGLRDEHNAWVFSRLVHWAAARTLRWDLVNASGLSQLWRAAEYLQIDDLQAAVEDELAQRFAAPSAAGTEAWQVTLALATSHVHSSSRLLHLAVRHLSAHTWEVLACRRAVSAVSEHAGTLRPGIIAELRDRLVALVTVAEGEFCMEL